MRACPRTACSSSPRWRAPGWRCIRPLRSGSFRSFSPSALYVVVAVGGSAYAGVIQRFIVATERTGTRDPVHPEQHQGDARGVRARQGRGTLAVGRRTADAGRSRAQCRDDRERAAVERAAAPRYVRPDSGDPHLLRLRLGRQRPLHHRRQVPSDHAVGARAELAQPAEPHLDQRAADVHAWLRPDARPGQRGDAGRAAGAVHPRSAARPRRSTSR